MEPYALERSPWGLINTLYSAFKRILSKKLDQNMPKNVYISESCNIAAASGNPNPLAASSGLGFHPQIPALLLPPDDIIFVVCVSTALNV